ncbi:MAG: regulatory protein RecX [Chloroflexota bacterium]|jgi:regulatory protein
MGTITALKAQVKNPDRVSVFVDDEFVVGLAAAVAAGLRVGQTITAADLTRLEQNEQAHRARERVVGLLARRPYSANEVIRYLRRHQYDEATINAVVDDLTEAGLIDDNAFAAYWVEQRETFRPRSRLALRQELSLKGVEREIVADALAEVDEVDAARRLARKKAGRYSHLSETEFQTKLSHYLQRQGFSYDIVREVVGEVVAEVVAESPPTNINEEENVKES